MEGIYLFSRLLYIIRLFDRSIKVSLYNIATYDVPIILFIALFIIVYINNHETWDVVNLYNQIIVDVGVGGGELVNKWPL